MTVPTFADADPDPSTQQAWPRKNRNQGDAHSGPGAEGRQAGQGPSHPGKDDHGAEHGIAHLSQWNLVTLSIAMAGAQIAWTVELG